MVQKKKVQIHQHNNWNYFNQLAGSKFDSTILESAQQIHFFLFCNKRLKPLLFLRNKPQPCDLSVKIELLKANHNYSEVKVKKNFKQTFILNMHEFNKVHFVLIFF